MLPFALSKQWKFFLKVLIALILSGLLILKVDWGFILKEYKDLQWQWLLIYIILQWIGIFLSVKRWQAIASEYKLGFSTDDGILVYLKGMFLNNFLPTTIGGDAYRCWWLQGKTNSPAASYASVALDRVMGLFVTTVAALVAGVFIPQLVLERELFTFTYIGILGAVILGSLVLLNFFFGWGKLPFQNKFFFQKSFFTFIWQKRPWRNILDILFWSSAFTFIALIISNYILFLALDIPLRPLAFSAVMLVVILYSNIPLSINNIGIKEWAYATFFVYLGVPLEAAVAVALLSRFFQLLISFMVIPLVLVLEGSLFFGGPKNSPPPDARDPRETVHLA